uniref:Patatin n=1 Tax=Mantoniella antarctica TaxID=81844 RepID=A0A7S0X6V2_9CHLO|mmetsp:Transcript_18170/g.45161  ORF Transcript_18170/g.45161 Transcript_18170/m.45161 type:complete len:345 (+) Transcript_18170:149-1183(+)
MVPRHKAGVETPDETSARLRLGLACGALYIANVVLHALVFAKRNPTRRPSRQNTLLMVCRLLFGVPVNIVVGAWLATWILIGQIINRPLWKPTTLPLPNELHASVAMCGGGFRTWYHLGIYWGMYDALGVDGIKKVKFSGASIGALVATVAACGVHPADIWAHIPAIAEAYRGAAFFGHLTKVGQFCRYLLHCTLPADAHMRVKGRLFISISSLLPVPHNHIQSEFTSREDLIDAVIAAGYIPTWTHPGLCLHRGMICVDGGVTNNLPALSEDSLRIGLDAEDISAWNADLVPSKPLARINTFIPADEANLQRMLNCGKDDIRTWLATPAGRVFVETVQSTESC